MALTYSQEVGTGTSQAYDIHWESELGFLDRSHVYVYAGDDYEQNTIPFTWINDTRIECVATGDFRIRRIVPRSVAWNNYIDGAILSDKNLNDSYAQCLMIEEEITDGFISPNDGIPIVQDLDMRGYGIINTAEATENTSVPTLGQVFDEIQKELAKYFNDIDSISVVPIVTPPQTADGVQTQFNCGGSAVYPTGVYLITFSGVVQRKSDYTIPEAGKVEFNQVPPLGAVIDVVLYAPVLAESSTLTNLEVAGIGGSIHREAIVDIAEGVDITDVTGGYHDETGITFNLTGDAGVITSIPATFSTTGVLELNFITTQLRRRDPVVESKSSPEAYSMGVTIDANTDWGPIWRSMYKDLSRRGKRALVTCGHEKYLIKTPQPDGDIPEDNPAFGKKVALWCERADLIAINGGGAFVILDKDSPAVAGLDDQVCVSRGDVDEQAFVNWQDITFHGGLWDDINDEPDYNLRMDYNITKYSYFKGVKTNRCRTTNWRICGFVNTIIHCDARFASAHSNLFIFGSSVFGGTAARTGWTIQNNTFDYAGLYGLIIAGGSGHTYCSVINNTADHIGRDRQNNTIVANIGESAAYFFAGCFDFTWLSNGCEVSTRHLRINSSRIMNIQGLYSFGLGSTDAGNPVNEAIIVDGASSTISLKGYRAASATNLTYALRYETPAYANSLSIKRDDTIPNNKVDPASGQGGDKTSSASVMMALEDMYIQGYRKRGRDMVVGDPVTHDKSFSQSGLSSINDHKFTTGSGAVPVVYTLLQVDDITADGNLSTFITVKAGSSFGGVPKIPARYQWETAIDSSSFAMSPKNKVSLGAHDFDLELAWAGDKLQLTTSEPFGTFSVETENNGRPSGASMSTTWVGVIE